MKKPQPVRLWAVREDDGRLRRICGGLVCVYEESDLFWLRKGGSFKLIELREVGKPKRKAKKVRK